MQTVNFKFVQSVNKTNIYFLTLLTLEYFSQLNASGTVLCTDKKNIAFTDIGIVGSGIGSISNEDGSFSLPVPDNNLKDLLTFSAIQFNRKTTGKIIICFTGLPSSIPGFHFDKVLKASKAT